MLKLLPFILIIAYALLMWRFSAWRLHRELDARSEPLDDPALESVVRRLGRAVGLEHLRAHVFKIPVFNGLASPDGRVFITDGVMDKYRLGQLSAEEIGSIIAHELGHVALGHSRRRMIDWTGQNMLRMVLMVILGRFLPIIGIWIANVIANLLMAKLSRADEFEADAFAAALMEKAGVDGDAQVTMFEKLARFAPGGADGGPAWLMSHPPIPERIRAVRELQQSWRGRAPAAR